MTWTQAYSLSTMSKMGTFPKLGKDHNNSDDPQNHSSSMKAESEWIPGAEITL